MMISKKAQRSHKSKEQSSKITTYSTETNLEESRDYKPESKINSKIARIQFVFSGRFASVKHPQANGLVERANRSLGEGVKARLDKGSKDWIEEVLHILWAYQAVIPAEIDMPTLRTTEIQNNEALRINLDLLEEKKEQAAIREARSKAKMEKYLTPKSATQVSNQETLCTESMMPAMQNMVESLALSGKDRMK
ncbi:reverse transcriptase domain-containing protein [Tanacetum coccineum]